MYTYRIMLSVSLFLLAPSLSLSLSIAFVVLSALVRFFENNFGCVSGVGVSRGTCRVLLGGCTSSVRIVFQVRQRPRQPSSGAKRAQMIARRHLGLTVANWVRLTGRGCVCTMIQRGFVDSRQKCFYQNMPPNLNATIIVDKRFLSGDVVEYDEQIVEWYKLLKNGENTYPDPASRPWVLPGHSTLQF